MISTSKQLGPSVSESVSINLWDPDKTFIYLWYTLIAVDIVPMSNISASDCLDASIVRVGIFGPGNFHIISSTVRLFADNCVIYRPINSKCDQEILQKDLNLLTYWSEIWQMEFNIKNMLS